MRTNENDKQNNDENRGENEKAGKVWKIEIGIFPAQENEIKSETAIDNNGIGNDGIRREIDENSDYTSARYVIILSETIRDLRTF